MPAGTVGVQGYLNGLAAGLLRRYRRSEREAAHTLFGLSEDLAVLKGRCRVY